MFLKSHKQLNSKLGFTLIELLVVIVIIGILATLTTVSLTSARGKARDARRISDLKQIATALELYQADNNSYPTLITGGNALVNPNDASKVYMKKVPSDPSTNTSYNYYGSTSRFTLRTTIEKSVDNIPVGPVIVTSGGGVKQAVNSDNGFMNPDLTFGSLVAHWPLDGVNGSRDLISGSVATNSAGVATSSGRFNEVEGAYLFNGSSNGVTTAFGNGYNPYVNKLSVTLWVKPSVLEQKTVISTPTGTNQRLYVGNRYGKWSVGVQSLGWGGGSKSVTTEWTFLVLVLDAGTANLYANKLLSETKAYTDYSLAGNVVIGSLGGGGYYFTGYISDVRIYNDALDTDEINAIYNATRP